MGWNGIESLLSSDIALAIGTRISGLLIWQIEDPSLNVTIE